MFRGSRLAASFLLVLTGLAATAAALFVVPAAVARGVAWPVLPVAITAAILHFAALSGLARGRDWGRNLAVFIADTSGLASQGLSVTRLMQAMGMGKVLVSTSCAAFS